MIGVNFALATKKMSLAISPRLCRGSQLGLFLHCAVAVITIRPLYTPTMTLKNAASLALIGTILATVLLVCTFVFSFVNVLRGLAPPLMLFPWFVYSFACFSVAVFFYVFHRAQS